MQMFLLLTAATIGTAHAQYLFIPCHDSHNSQCTMSMLTMLTIVKQMVATMTSACRELPGELERVMIWFRDYKIPDGKPANAYGYDSRPMNSDFAKLVIGETHEMYSNLKEGKRENNGNLALS